MVIDAAKGIEARTRKLFEVCRLRDIPIITFINKMDRESRDPFDLLDEIEKTLALDTAPMTWPIGRGRDFAGTLDIATGEMRLLSEDGSNVAPQPLDLAALAQKNPMLDAKAIAEELALVKDACRRFDFDSFREGHLTPVFFGSALKNFGVKDLLDALAAFAPPPRAQVSNKRTIDAHEGAMTAFVFKIQANMDPNHRDRIAFARLCSGKLRRGMKAKLVRTDKPMTLSAPQFFFAQDRTVADEAYAGDVVGIPNHGTLRIGDTLTEGEDIAFLGVPNFAPEILRRVKLGDPMKAKKLKEALQQMAEEGVVQVFRPLDGAPALVGVVGPLQLDVLKVRLSDEYGLDIGFETPEFSARALDFLRRRQKTRRFRASQLFQRGRGFGRRSRVHGAQPIHPRLHRRARARHRFHRHQGREKQGGVTEAVIPGRPKAATRNPEPNHSFFVALDSGPAASRRPGMTLN